MVLKQRRGRPRKRQVVVPAHIDAAKLPDYCYWDASGQGHWYTKFSADGKSRRKRIAGPDATLADLHKLMEVQAGKDTDNLNWLWGLFQKSPQFKALAETTRTDYDYCHGVVGNHPTRRQIPTGRIPLKDWEPPMVQKLIDQISEVNGPSSAAHVARYLKRLFTWAVQRGYVRIHPVGKLEMPKERKRRRLPESEVTGKLITFARERGEMKPHTKGSCSPFIWKVLVISRFCRLRGIEIRTLTDDKVLEKGLHCKRVKGSAENITEWTPDLKAAIKAAQTYRDDLWKERKMPVPMRPDQRPILVTTDGDWISQTAWQNAWRRFRKQAIEAGVMTEDQVFSLHDMKRRSVTDTKGTKQEKMLASGHKSIDMLDVYDRSVPVVPAADAK